MKSTKGLHEEGLENVEDLLKDIASLQVDHEFSYSSSSSYSSSDDSQECPSLLERRPKNRHAMRTKLYSFHNKWELLNNTVGLKKKLNNISYDPFKSACGKTARFLLTENGRRRTIFTQKTPKVECIPMTPDEGCDLDFLALPIEIQCPS